MRLPTRCFVAFVSFGVLCQSASAITAFSNFGSGMSFQADGTGPIIGYYSPLGTAYQQAFQFTSSASGSVSGISVALSKFSSYTGTGTVPTFDLFTDSGSNTIGGLLGTWTGVMPTANLGSVQSLTGGSATLNAGGKYWLVAREPTLQNVFVWNYNSQGGKGMQAFSSNLGSSYNYLTNRDQCAFQIDVAAAPVPEPFSMALAGIGALAGYHRIRTRKA